jgi:hypothetical protein
MKSVIDLRLALAAGAVFVSASLAGAQTYILAANSTSNSVHLFDKANGAVLDKYFIYESRMSIAFEPMKVGNEIWVCDQGASAGAIWRFNQNGLGLGKIDLTATYGTNNTRGMAIVPRAGGDEVWVAQAGTSTTPGRLLRYSTSGQPLGTFTTTADSTSPWDVYVRDNEVYVGDATSDDIDRYDFNGNFLGKYVNNVSGTAGFPTNAPEQIAQLLDGRVIIANRVNPSEIYVFDDTTPRENPNFPNFTAYLRLSSRGVIALEDGTFIYSRGDGFYRQSLDPNQSATNLFKEAGFESARYMNRATLVQSPRDPAAQWAGDAPGNWSTDASWTNTNAPLSVPESAVLGSAITSARTVTLNQQATIFTLAFDNDNSYTISGTGSLNFSGDIPQAISVLKGEHVINVPVTSTRAIRIDVGSITVPNPAPPPATVLIPYKLTLAAGLDTGANDIAKLGKGTLEVNRIRGGFLSIGEGKVVLTAPGGAGTSSRVTGLYVMSNQTPLDIGLNDLVIDGPTQQNLVSIRSYMSVGRVYSVTAGSYIRPGFARAGSIGVTSWDGESVSADATIVRRTLPGDANLDRVVDFDDLLRLAANYNLTDRYWYEGDFNYNGTVNFDDLLLLAANYNQTLTGTLEGDWALANASVPEPTALAAIGASAAVALRRRRRA